MAGLGYTAMQWVLGTDNHFKTVTHSHSHTVTYQLPKQESHEINVLPKSQMIDHLLHHEMGATWILDKETKMSPPLKGHGHEGGKGY